MKVDDLRSQNKESEPVNNNKKFKLKLKDHGLDIKLNKSGFNSAHGKLIAHPHSYR